MTGSLDGYRQTALFMLLKPCFFALFNLPKLVNIALQGLKVLVVKICYVCPVFKNLRHNNLEQRQTYGISLPSKT